MIEVWQIWIIVGIVLWIIEIFTPGSFVMGIFGTSCLIVAPFAGVGMSVKMQLLIFGVATVIMAFGIRPLIMRHFYRREDKTKTNVEALVGKSGLVTEDIDYMAGTGRVKIGGEVWSAITPDESRVAIGQKVTVREIEGCKVIVEVTNEKEGRKS